ncbi:MAG: hypothetical protein LBT76_06105 [Tannerella sp.]|nr:hypothetical protein [Tannerella sp.]
MEIRILYYICGIILIKENMNPTQDAVWQQKPAGNSHNRFRQPFFQQSETVQYPAGWEEGLTSEEFLLETKKNAEKEIRCRKSSIIEMYCCFLMN